MNRLGNVLMVEDNLGDIRLIREMLDEDTSRSVKFAHVGCMRDAEAFLSKSAVDIILLDLGLPDTQGLEGVRRARAAAPRVPVVVLTGSSDESLGMEALHEGAEDYLFKDQIEARGLLRALRYAIERKNLKMALRGETERAQATLNCIGDAVICTDMDGNITFVNVVAEKITGWSWEEAHGRPMSEIFHVIDATSLDVIPNRMDLALRENRVVYLPTNCILIRRDGFEVPIEDSASPIRDHEGAVIGAVVVFRDVSAARAMSLQLLYAAEHDFLTGLPNRLLLIDRIGQAIALAPRHGNKIALLFLDLDGFKHVNDSLGHPFGDKLLQSVAARLLDCVRASDTVSRQGGDEFVILLSDAEKWEDAEATANRILERVGEAHLVDQHVVHITTSIGISIYPDDGHDAETLVKNSDTAMYHAKENGRQSFRFFTPAMNIRAVERQAIEQGLRQAIINNEFILHYQPKIDLESGKITGAEALLRWINPLRGLVSPLHFIPVAEDSGLIVPIGAWVFREASRQTQAWIDRGLAPIKMAVNVSAREFRGKNFLENLLGTLGETRLDPHFLEVELTESILMNNAESAVVILQALREKGITIAIDDFGTGYSSLSYLRKFPVDCLKIDQSFVRQISIVGEDTAIVTAVIAMAHSLNLRVIAEGVETAEELEFLRAHQCDEGQGYYFSRPVPAEQFENLLRSAVPG